MKARWKRYSDEELTWLRENSKCMDLYELVPAFNERFGRNRTFQQIRSTMNNYGIRSGRKKVNKPFVVYTDEQVQFLKDHFQTMTKQELTDAFNERFEPKRTFWAIEGQLKRRGFVKYHRRTLKVGDETLCPATGYITVKTDAPAPNMKTKRNYRYKHLVVWEEANGPVPEGMYIRFLDGDKTNCSLDNLVMVSMAEHGILNKLNLKELHPDLWATAIDTARLQAKCIELGKVSH